jgi:hypothetical protein
MGLLIFEVRERKQQNPKVRERATYPLSATKVNDDLESAWDKVTITLDSMRLP